MRSGNVQHRPRKIPINFATLKFHEAQQRNAAADRIFVRNFFAFSKRILCHAASAYKLGYATSRSLIAAAITRRPLRETRQRRERGIFATN